MDEPDWLDEDGYPTDAALDRVREWPWSHPEGWRGLFDFIKSIWYMADWGWHEEAGTSMREEGVTKLHISTAGWSGNESIVRAMQENFMLQATCWEQSRRGGHFIYELKPRDSRHP